MFDAAGQLNSALWRHRVLSTSMQVDAAGVRTVAVFVLCACMARVYDGSAIERLTQ